MAEIKFRKTVWHTDVEPDEVESIFGNASTAKNDAGGEAVRYRRDGDTFTITAEAGYGPWGLLSGLFGKLS